MIKQFGFSPLRHVLPDRPLVLNVSQLREDERLEFKYDSHNNLVAIQKVKLSLFREQMEGTAETDIEPTVCGRVFYGGSSWKAVVDEDVKILAGQKVLVTARQNLTLLVVPAF